MSAATRNGKSRPGNATSLASDLGKAFEQLYVKLRNSTLPGGPGMTAVRTLANLQQYGSQRISELVALEGISQPGMTTLVTKLEEQGLVKRRSDERDGRVVNVEITEAGLELLRVRRAARAEIFAEDVKALSPEDQAVIAAAVPALLRLTAPAPQGQRNS